LRQNRYNIHPRRKRNEVGRAAHIKAMVRVTALPSVF